MSRGSRVIRGSRGRRRGWVRKGAVVEFPMQLELLHTKVARGVRELSVTLSTQKQQNGLLRLTCPAVLFFILFFQLLTGVSAWVRRRHRHAVNLTVPSLSKPGRRGAMGVECVGCWLLVVCGR